MDWVLLPEGIRALRVKRVTYEKEHEFNWGGKTHVGQSVSFQLENVDFGDLEELDEGQGWSGIFPWAQEIKGNGLWHKAMPDHDSPSMRSAGTFALYTKYVRGMLGPEAATVALSLAREGKWDWQLLVGMESMARIVHKTSDGKEYANLVPFQEMDDYYDIENAKSMFTCTKAQEESNKRMLKINVEREPSAEEPAEKPKPTGPCLYDQFLKGEMLPMIKKVNKWDKDGNAAVDSLSTSLIYWAAGTIVEKLSLIGECRKHGGLPFKSLPEREKILMLSELAYALSNAGYEVPDPPQEIGGGKLWYTDLARSVKAWSGYTSKGDWQGAAPLTYRDHDNL